MTAAAGRSARGWLLIAGAVAPGRVSATLGFVRIVGAAGPASPPGVVETVLFGLAIFGAATLLSWGAEVAQLDISEGLAIAFLAFVAVLPEYAVDLVFAWKGGQQDAVAGAAATLCGETHPCRQLAIANMTGSNRLLIGLGWAAVVLVWWRTSGARGVDLGDERRTELGFLTVATLWAFGIPIRGELSLLDTVVLVALFLLYLAKAAGDEQEHPDLVGPPVVIAALSVAARRSVTIVMFAYAAAAILLVAENFAEGIVFAAESSGLDPFHAVQWLAPLASEAPEMIIAILLVLRAKPEQGLGALISSKVNQWTLLVGTVPLVYALARGEATALILNAEQREEVFLTAAQSLFAVAVVANLKISRGEATVLLVLFLAQFGIRATAVRVGFAVAYVAFALVLLLARDARRGVGEGVARVFARTSRPG